MLSKNEREDWAKALALYDKLTAEHRTRPDGTQPSVWICEALKSSEELDVTQSRMLRLISAVDVAMAEITRSIRPGIAAVFLPHMYLDAYGFTHLRQSWAMRPELDAARHGVNTEIRRLWLQERVDGHPVKKLLTREQIEHCIRVHTNEGELT